MVAPTDLVTSHHLRRSELYGLLAIVAVHVLLRAGFYQGILPSDPIFYVHYAQKIATGEFQLEYHHFNTRFAVTLPVALFFKVFGINEFAVALWPSVCSLATLYLTFRLGMIFGGPKAGLLASALLAVLPLDIGMAMQLLPEPIMTAMLTTCVWCFYNGYHSQHPTRSRLWLVAGGLALWCAYSAKILGVLLGPLLLVYALTKGFRLEKLIWFSLGFLALLIPEYSFYFIKSGDLFFPFHAISMGVYESDPSVLVAHQNLNYRLLRALPSLTIYPSLQFGITFCCIYFAAAYSCLSWKKNLLLLLWFGGLLAYNNFGSAMLTRYMVLPAVPRYLHPVMIPGLIILGMTLSKMAFSRSDLSGMLPGHQAIKIFGRVVIVGVLSTSLFFATFGLRRSYLELSAIELGKLSPFLQANLQGTVYADEKDLSTLRFLLRDQANERLRRFPEPGVSDGLCDYVRRFTADAKLLYNWRVLSTDAWLFSPGQREMLVELYEKGILRPHWAYWDKPGAWFYKVAGLDLFSRTLGKQDQIEFFEGKESVRGIVLFAIDPNFCETSPKDSSKTSLDYNAILRS